MLLSQYNYRDLQILAILTGFAFLISFSLSAPGLSTNDESITVNQLHQLFQGSDILINEGKFGTTSTGEISAYYDARRNYLAYSLFLPVISLPALFVIESLFVSNTSTTPEPTVP